MSENDDLLTPSSSDSTDTSLGSPLKKCKISRESDSALFCRICQQNVLDPKTKFFQSLPDSGLEEEAALTDDRLLLYSEGEFIPDVDSKPMHKITQFTVFDGEGHLCPFDSGLIERDELIFFSGYIKPVYDDDPSPVNGVPAQEMGPILEWWISGFDGGDSFILGLATPYADYILMEPSSDYAGFMRMPKQKALISKIVIEFLNSTQKPTYEELLSRLREVSVPEDIGPLNEHWLRKHAQFVVDQIREVDEKRKLISTPAVQEMIRVNKLNTRSRQGRKFQMRRKVEPKVTSLILEKFRFFFGDTPEKVETVFPSASKEISEFSWNVGENSAIVNNEVISTKDFVFIYYKDKTTLVRVEYFFQQNFTKQAHCIELIYGKDTILGEASHPQEFFFLEKCSDWPICKIQEKADVSLVQPPTSWKKFLNYQVNIPKKGFFVQKSYSQIHGTFEDLKISELGPCGVCERKKESEKWNCPAPLNGNMVEPGITTYEKIMWRGEEYSRGCCVFLEPFAVVFDAQKSSKRIEKTLVTLKTDEFIYPEVYRKAKEISLTDECPEPFVVGYIKNVFGRIEGLHKKLFLTVKKFYRAENTGIELGSLDLDLLYWSEEETEVSFEHVRGRCNVVFSKVPPPASLRPRFYFNSVFDAEKETFMEVKPPWPLKETEETAEVLKKLKTLNAFSGCGGLAEGLRQSGITDVLWAVEIDKSTCRAFKSNFPNVAMFEKDCNLFLSDVFAGKVSDENGLRYPRKGDVELLCGGPPCQGFSTMNRFSSKEESQYNNSLILTYLSFCDHYRPKFFLLENVRNFVGYKKSVFLKHALSSLIAMGYQCNFGVIQAGNYGLPQCRRRLFIFASAPGCPLPDFPKPTHVFYGALKNFEYEVNGLNFCGKLSNEFSGSAPYRRVTIRDAISDLSGVSDLTESSPPKSTYYKRFLMGRPSVVRDQVSKGMSPINEARIKHVPASKGCDWRDLPNIPVRLRDGTLSNVLKYTHHDRKNGKSCCGLLRGVCGCASGDVCDPQNRQNNTLIPWFLVHTANRNNNWTGLYGRLDWDGVFSTVTTNPEPSGQQGRVLHPTEDRTISVRESARAQGLPDSFKLFGTVSEKYKQIGNAVPCPVARALGYEIRLSLLENSASKSGD